MPSLFLKRPDGRIAYDDTSGAGPVVVCARGRRRARRRLGITKFQIEKRQPWQSSIESAFSVQQRMADYHFQQATTWADLQAAHKRWFLDSNYQGHWTHR